jgi:hypothetical protein
MSSRLIESVVKIADQIFIQRIYMQVFTRKIQFVATNKKSPLMTKIELK